MRNKWKILIIISWVFILQIEAQDSLLFKPLSINFSNITKDSALILLEKKINLNLTYNSELVKSDEYVNAEFSNTPLNEILDVLIQKETISYQIVGKQLVFFKENKMDSVSQDIQIDKKHAYISIQGIIVDSRTKKPLPFATIGIYNKSIGTVSNEEGRFLVKIHEEFAKDTLIFDYLGYRSKAIPVQEIKGDLQVKLNQLSISLQEVIIRSSNPKTLIENAISNKLDNYPVFPVMIRSFYRESLKKDEKYMMYTEGLLDVYKSSYGPTVYTDQVRLIKKRRYTNVSQYDTVMFRLRGGIQSSLALDIIKNPLDFLDIDQLDKYSYNLSDIIVHNGKLAYLIDFKENESLGEMDYAGTIYIDISSLAIVKVEFGLTQSSLKNARKSFVIKSSSGIDVKPMDINYEINYREINGKYYINHVTGMLLLKVKKRGKVIHGKYETRFEMISTDIDSTNIIRFSGREKIRNNMIFSDWNAGYGMDFWENENFIIPESNLEKALSRFKETELVITK